MSHRTSLSLAVLFLMLGFAFTETSAGDLDSSAKPKLSKSDIDAMMKSLSNWGRWGARRPTRRFEPDHTLKGASRRPHWSGKA